MSPLQFHQLVKELRLTIGPQAQIYLSMSADDMTVQRKVMSVVIYPLGICHSNERLECGQADDFESLWDLVQAEWAKHQEVYQHRVVRRMALAIIKLRAERGECTDAALRLEPFDQSELDRFITDACKDADTIAGNGPFTVRVVPQGNGAPADRPPGWIDQ